MMLYLNLIYIGNPLEFYAGKKILYWAADKKSNIKL